jgi:hypothetical protein
VRHDTPRCTTASRTRRMRPRHDRRCLSLFLD